MQEKNNFTPPFLKQEETLSPPNPKELVMELSKLLLDLNATILKQELAIINTSNTKDDLIKIGLPADNPTVQQFDSIISDLKQAIANNRQAQQAVIEKFTALQEENSD
jgi:hypothetical protein